MFALAVAAAIAAQAEIWLDHNIGWETLDPALPKRSQSSLNANE